MKTQNYLAIQTIPVKDMAKALGSPIRWAILGELSDGQPGMVLAIAKKLNLPAVTVSQHMGVLRRAGVVVVGLGGLYTIAPQFMADAAQGHLDFGLCLLRLKKSDEPTT
jgi:DNA-binding transcriptional ArsR family regulator